MSGGNEPHAWLRKAGTYRWFRRHSHLGCVYPGVLVLAAVASFRFLETWPWLPVVPLILAVFCFYCSRWIFFHRIYCRRCGYNPTRRKADGARRKDYYKVMAQLSRYPSCPDCGAED